ncbi:MAG TPA: response regulator [Nitrospira sp.]|nr:response regulator [Nitrospira sp.]
MAVALFSTCCFALPVLPAILSEGMMPGKTVLVIEDDIIQREMLVTELRHQGFTVVTATEGNEALSRLFSDPFPDLILLDMLNPSGERDGWWFLNQRQHIPAIASVPVVITTSLGAACEEWAASLGADGLIRKPFDVEPLLAEIQHLLDEKTKDESAVAPSAHRPHSCR